VYLTEHMFDERRAVGRDTQYSLYFDGHDLLDMM
jgi:hypothetical protein